MCELCVCCVERASCVYMCVSVNERDVCPVYVCVHVCMVCMYVCVRVCMYVCILRVCVCVYCVGGPKVGGCTEGGVYRVGGCTVWVGVGVPRGCVVSCMYGCVCGCTTWVYYVRCVLLGVCYMLVCVTC